ncbi:MAG: D-aminoacyl-tRNA deacylase [Rhodothermales bacterium]
MVALIQRVKEARVDIDGDTVGAIGPGMLILLGIHHTDTDTERDWVARKCANLRIFPDDEGRMNRSVRDVHGGVLVVSQFTLYGNTAKGNRPSFIASARPEMAEPMYEAFVDELSHLLGQPVPTGRFGAMMDVHLVNDGPVTLWVERRADT